MINNNSEEIKNSINRFNQMLKTKLVYYFDVKEFQNITEYYLSFGEVQLSKKALSMGLNQHPHNIDLLLIKIEHLILEKKLNSAKKILNDLDLISPFNEEIFIQKALVESKLGNHLESINLLIKLLDFTSEPIDVWNLIGMEYLLIEDYYNAEYFFKNCILENPEDYPSLYNLLHCYEQMNLNKKAINVLKNTIKLNPYSEIAWHQLGCIYSKMDKIEKAISCFDYAIISDNKLISAYIEKAKIFELKNQFVNAIDNYNLVLKFNDPSAFIYTKIGECYINLNDKKKGLKYFLKAIHIEPSFEKSWIKLIDFYIKLKKYKKASLYLHKSLRINPDCIDLWEKSVKVNKNLKLKKNVTLSYETMIDLGDSRWSTLISCIDEWIIQKNWKKAIEIGLKAKSYFPNKSEIFYKLAGCYMKLGQNLKSNNSIKTGKKIGLPNFKTIKMFPELKTK
ncbi:MAG: tetratricopeptide repeat protein [Flavobacteriaceae bacterium]|tara:strand:+ start:72 stop:1424 length:1353 start_codon:yes stop_codon:yes gene_type:complete